MSACPAPTEMVGGVAEALRRIDCVSGDATALAFGRLFGSGGALLPALTIVLTLYIAFIAIGLLTGRSRLGVVALTPRMMTLGLVLTFATSWMAYQSVVWNLAVGAPDQVASLLLGTKGSATEAFGGRIDLLFGAIAEAASDPAPVAAEAVSSGDAATVAKAAASGMFKPADLLWLSALMLLLGTVGVLVTAKLALAALLALGPIFVVMALFRGTRGLFEGWLKGAVMFAVTPLFAVLIGGGVLELAVPVVGSLRGVDGLDSRAVVTLFLIAAVYLALMAIVVRTAAMMVAGWHVFGRSETMASDQGHGAAGSAGVAGTAVSVAPAAQPSAAAVSDRARAVAAALPVPANDRHDAPAASQGLSRTTVIHGGGGDAVSPLARATDRTRGVGSRFRVAAARFPKEKS